MIANGFLHQIAMVYLPWLWGYINVGTKAGPSGGCSALLWRGLFYEISCVTTILSHLSNVIDYNAFFLLPPQTAHRISLRIPYSF